MGLIQTDVIKTITILTCDFCNRTSEHNGAYIVKCFGCSKDICNNCYRFVLDLHEPSSDFSHKVCKHCAKKADSYQKLSYLIREKAFDNIERLYKKWKAECLNNNG